MWIAMGENCEGVRRIVTTDLQEVGAVHPEYADLTAAAPEMLIKVRQLATLLRHIHSENGLPALDLHQLEKDTIELIAKAEGKK